MKVLCSSKILAGAMGRATIKEEVIIQLSPDMVRIVSESFIAEIPADTTDAFKDSESEVTLSEGQFDKMRRLINCIDEQPIVLQAQRYDTSIMISEIYI